MSLMNDMLRDLEKRQAPDRTQQVDAQGYGALTQKAETSSNHAVVVLLSVIIILLLVLAVGWWYLTMDNATRDDRELNGNNLVSSENIPALDKDATRAELTVAPEAEPQIVQALKPVAPAKAVNNQKTVQPTVAMASGETVEQISRPQEIQTTQTLQSKETIVPEPQVIAHTPQQQTPLVVKPIEQKAVATHKPAETSSENTVVTESGSTVVSKVLVVSAEQRDENSAEAADELIATGQTQVAITQLKAFVEGNSVDVKSRALLVTLLMNDGNMADANALLTNDKLALSSHLRRLKAHWLVQNSQPDEAIALLNTNRPSIEADPEYHALLAALYQQQGFSSEAVASYAELLSFNPNIADWWAGMAIALDSSQQYPSAKRAYQKALQMDGLRFELAAFAKQRLATIGG